MAVWCVVFDGLDMKYGLVPYSATHIKSSMTRSKAVVELSCTSNDPLQCLQTCKPCLLWYDGLINMINMDDIESLS